ncbi:hypothetical protein Dimus_037721, partial [Dionaea muscipula]
MREYEVACEGEISHAKDALELLLSRSRGGRSARAVRRFTGHGAAAATRKCHRHRSRTETSVERRRSEAAVRPSAAARPCCRCVRVAAIGRAARRLSLLASRRCRFANRCSRNWDPPPANSSLTVSPANVLNCTPSSQVSRSHRPLAYIFMYVARRGSMHGNNVSFLS